MRHILRIFLATASLALAVFTLPANASSPEPFYLQRFFADSPDVGYLETAHARSKKRMHFRGISPRADHKPGIHPQHRHGAKGIRVPHRHAHKGTHFAYKHGHAHKAADRHVERKRKFGAKHHAHRDARPMAPHRRHEPRPDLPRAGAHKKGWKHRPAHSHKVVIRHEARHRAPPCLRKHRPERPHQRGERLGHRAPAAHVK